MRRKTIIQLAALALLGPPGLAVVVGIGEGTISLPAVVCCLAAFAIGCGLLLWSERRWPA